MKIRIASSLAFALVLPAFLQGAGCGPADPAPPEPGSSTEAGGSLTGPGGGGGTHPATATGVENAVVGNVGSVTGSPMTSTNGGGASGADGMAGAAGAGGAPATQCRAEETWRRAARFALVDPVDFGAVPDGSTDATAA